MSAGGDLIAGFGTPEASAAARPQRRHDSSRNLCHGSARTPGATAVVVALAGGAWWTSDIAIAAVCPRLALSAAANRSIGAAIDGVILRPALHST